MKEVWCRISGAKYCLSGPKIGGFRGYCWISPKGYNTVKFKKRIIFLLWFIFLFVYFFLLFFCFHMYALIQKNSADVLCFVVATQREFGDLSDDLIWISKLFKRNFCLCHGVSDSAWMKLALTVVQADIIKKDADAKMWEIFLSATTLPTKDRPTARTPSHFVTIFN